MDTSKKTIDKSSNIPIYKQLSEIIKEEIATAKVGEKLPSDRSLMKRFGLSYLTIKQAMDLLMRDGLIRREVGRGTFIAEREHRQYKESSLFEGRDTILVVYPDFLSTNVSLFTHLCDRIATKRSLNTMYYKTQGDTDYSEIAKFCQSREDEKITGIIVIPPLDRQNLARIKILNSIGLPVIWESEIDDDLSEYTNVKTFSDNPRKIGSMMIEFLIDKGHTSLCYVGNEPSSPNSDKTIEGIKEVAKKNKFLKRDLIIGENRVKSFGRSEQAAYDGTKNVLEKKQPTAIMYDSAGGAIAGIRALHEAGLKVPEDVSVIAGNYSYLFDYSIPKLTAISQDYEKKIEAIIDTLQGKVNAKVKYLHIDPVLLEQESVATVK